MDDPDGSPGRRRAATVIAGARVVESRHAIAWIVLRPTERSPQWSVFCPVGESAKVLAAIDEARRKAAEQKEAGR